MTEMQQKLLNNRIILIQGADFVELFDYVRDSLRELELSHNSPDITVEIESNGGNVDFALYIYDLIRLYKGNTTGVVVGYARSMAAIILQACKKRRMFQHSYLRIHNTSNHDSETAKDKKDSKKMKKVIERLDFLDTTKANILVKKTGQTRTFISKLMDEDRDMDAIEARQLNFVDEII